MYETMSDRKFKWGITEESFRPHYGPGVDSASNINEYQECFLGGKGGRRVGLATLSPSCVDYLKIWEPQPPVTLRACNWITLLEKKWVYQISVAHVTNTQKCTPILLRHL
jgi:hypothetical protein